MKELKLFFVLLIMAGFLYGQPLTAQTTSEEPPQEAEEAPSTGADLTRANELVVEQKYAEAELLLAELQAEFARDPDLLAMRGELLNALNRPDDAIEVLRQAAELEPDRPRVHFQLGSALAVTGRTDAALEAFGKEIEVNDEVAVVVLARLNRSMLYQQKSAWAESVRELEAVLELEPARGPVYGDLVALYLQLDRPDDAVEALRRGEAAGFVSARHWYSVGARLYSDGKYEPAVEFFTRTLEVDPNLADAERSLAAALEQLDREAEAVRHLKRYLELAPDAPDADAVAAKIREAESD